MTQTNETVRVRAKAGCRLIVGRNQFGRPKTPAPGEWFDLAARELGNIAVAAQVETEEQAAASDAAAEAPAESVTPPDPGFMRGRSVFVSRQEREVENARTVAADATEDALDSVAEGAVGAEGDTDGETPTEKGRGRGRRKS